MCSCECRLREKEIELAAERKMHHCCDIIFAGREREIALKEKALNDLTACKIKNIRDNLCCCKQGFDGGF